MKTPEYQLRFIEVNGQHYLRIDDVVAFMRELGSSEETDVRDRIDAAAAGLVQRLNEAVAKAPP